MQSDEPVHGLWCSARLKRTACRVCGRPLVFFYCDCGCMVMVEWTGVAWQVHACQPGLNRFSERDAFAIGRAIDRRIRPAELSDGKLDGVRLTPEFEALPPPEEWPAGKIRAIRISFVAGSHLPEGDESASRQSA